MVNDILNCTDKVAKKTGRREYIWTECIASKGLELGKKKTKKNPRRKK